MSTDEILEGALASWRPGAMFPSEVAWLAEQAQAAEVELVIECGRQDGIGTWTLGSLLAPAGIRIASIDFDDDPAQAARARARLEGLPVDCISGDIHVQVPRILRANAGTRIAVIQDGPKGWEGLATLLAAAHERDVVLIGQHNLHLGHRSRTAFQMLAGRACFLEDVAHGDHLDELRAREVAALSAQAPNRPLDHTSLGLAVLDDRWRAHLIDAIDLLRPQLRPWDPTRVHRAWERGDEAYCTRLRRRNRFTLARFQRR